MPTLSGEDSEYRDLKDDIPGIGQCLKEGFLDGLVCNSDLLRDCIIDLQQMQFDPVADAEFEGCAAVAVEPELNEPAESLAFFNVDSDSANCQLTFPSGLVTVTANIGPDLEFTAGILIEIKCGGVVVGSTTVSVSYDSLGNDSNQVVTGQAQIVMPPITTPINGKDPAAVRYCATLTSGGNFVTDINTELCAEARCSVA